ncbi:MAG: 3-ketoacyl-ACP reductase [Frankiales bacterium]|nr:3-ketoacyl-ACP reductase [Frankiales bacterium]
MTAARSVAGSSGPGASEGSDGELWGDVRVLVTGGSQGIGLGIARVFTEAGARVAIAGRDGGRLAAARDLLAAAGADVVTIQADVARSSSCEGMVAEAVERLGGLEVLCANAGVYPEAALEGMTEAHIDTVLGTNVKGLIFSVRAAVPALGRSGRGRVIVTSSITGPVTGFPGLGAYGASKAAQLGFVRTAALELARQGITVNAVLPGSIRTEGLVGLGVEAIARMQACIPLGRLGEVADIGRAALFFASRGASFVTGQSLTIDGGQTLPEIPEGPVDLSA